MSFRGPGAFRRDPRNLLCLCLFGCPHPSCLSRSERIFVAQSLRDPETLQLLSVAQVFKAEAFLPEFLSNSALPQTARLPFGIRLHRQHTPLGASVSFGQERRELSKLPLTHGCLKRARGHCF